MKTTILLVFLSVGLCIADRALFDDEFWKNLEAKVFKRKLLLAHGRVKEGDKLSRRSFVAKKEVEAENEVEGSTPEQPGSGSGQESGAKWIFNGDWSEEIVGSLVAGEDFEVVYNSSRLPFYDQRYGQPAWNIFVRYKLSGSGYVHEALLENRAEHSYMTKTISLPYGIHSISMWFYSSAYSQGGHYDSDYRKNYNADVADPQQDMVVFTEDWREIVYGELKQAGQFVIMYSPTRLGDAVTAGMKFSDEGDVSTVELEAASNGYLTAIVHIPQDAHKVEMWFYAEVNGHKRYDSYFGDNYKFDVSQNQVNVARKRRIRMKSAPPVGH